MKGSNIFIYLFIYSFINFEKFETKKKFKVRSDTHFQIRPVYFHCQLIVSVGDIDLDTKGEGQVFSLSNTASSVMTDDS